MPSKDTAVTTGFYRYSDIRFEWYQVINDPLERAALKAFMGNTALVHPDHPFRKDGVKGVELFIGTLPNGQSRLLFSSAQIEYARYWLLQMGLTKSLLPLPSSDYLVTESTLRNWSAVYYKTAQELKKALRIVDKNNKRLKGTDSELLSVRQTFERARTYWGEKAGTWLAIDFENWEMEHTMLTEFGWGSIRWENGEEIARHGHLVVKEYDGYRNSKYVPDHRDNYCFGTSEAVTKATFKKRICDLISELNANGPLFLVFHDASQDLRYLKSSAIDAPITGFTFLLPDATPDDGIYVVDTTDLFAALEGDVAERRGLEKVCRMLKIPTKYLHNAGNDAYYTLQVLKSMASGNQVDVQREDRWPNHTEPSGNGDGVKVRFDPWDEESDYSDTEGVAIGGNKVQQ